MYKKLTFIGFAIFALAIAGVYFWERNHPKTVSNITVDFAPLASALDYALPEAFAAEETGKAECNKKGEESFKKIDSVNSDYQHGALKFYRSIFYMLTKGFASEVEMTLCHFAKSMEVNPDKKSLPVTITKTFGAKTVKLEVVAPTESFATTLGYDAKATVTVNDSTFMVVYWGGSDESSKGFMIKGTNDIGGDKGEGGSKKHVSYIKWDRSSTTQTMNFWGSKFTTSYLGSATSSGSSERAKDRAFWGYASYNTSTAALSTRAVEISARNGSSFGCFRIWASGTNGGEMTIAKTDSSHSVAGESTTATYKDGTNMDAVYKLTDATTTANGTKNLPYDGFTFAGEVAPLITATPFEKSCNDIFTGAGTGKPFNGSEANFSASPTDVF